MLVLLRGVLLALGLLVVACGSSSSGEDPAGTRSDASPDQEQGQPSHPDPFDIGRYTNADEVRHLADGLFKKPFPRELTDDALEVPPEQASTTWEEFLLNTRVFRAIGNEITVVEEFCGGTGDRNTGTNLYSPNAPFGGNWYIGAQFTWVISPRDGSAWNHAALSYRPGPPPLSLEPGPNGPVSPTMAMDGTQSTEEIVVLDHPECQEVIPIKEFTAAQLDLVGVAGLGDLRVKPFPPELLPDSPQLPTDELIKVWSDYFEQVLILDNFTGLPATLACDRGSVMVLNRYASPNRLGIIEAKVYEDARDTRKNAIRVLHSFVGPERVGPGEPLIVDHDGDGKSVTLWPLFWETTDPASPLDPYSAFTAFETGPDCSYERGFEYVKRLIEREELQEYGELPFKVPPLDELDREWRRAHAYLLEN